MDHSDHEIADLSYSKDILRSRNKRISSATFDAQFLHDMTVSSDYSMLSTNNKIHSLIYVNVYKSYILFTIQIRKIKTQTA